MENIKQVIYFIASSGELLHDKINRWLKKYSSEIKVISISHNVLETSNLGYSHWSAIICYEDLERKWYDV
jgi:hypothetical protein